MTLIAGLPGSILCNFIGCSVGSENVELAETICGEFPVCTFDGQHDRVVISNL
jgi:hypothetical protein